MCRKQWGCHVIYCRLVRSLCIVSHSDSNHCWMKKWHIWVNEWGVCMERTNERGKIVDNLLTMWIYVERRKWRRRSFVTKDMQRTISSSSQHRKKEAREIFHVMGQILLYIFYVLLTSPAHIMSYLSFRDERRARERERKKKSVMRLNARINSIMCHYQ